MNSTVNRQTFAAQVFDMAVDAIVRGDFPSGSSISEAEIAARFGVSRAPAREALLRLGEKGLVVRRPHVGAHVIEFTRDDLIELFAIREALEGMACRLAAERISDEELARLDAALQSHSATPDLASGRSYFQSGGDQDFHFGIARASGNLRLERHLCDDLYHLLRVYRFRSSTRSGRAQQALAEHHAILDALKARDPDRAEAAMRHHIQQSKMNIGPITSNA
jgi:DNA-binding GntR family transcriptional regulator